MSAPPPDRLETDRWPLRVVPDALRRRYLDNGWWTDETLGDVVAAGLAAMPDTTFAVHSAIRPWQGTIGGIERQARSFAAWLAAEGIGAGDVVVVQLPNWAEAAIAFWGAAYAGAIVVPVVHFYGPKELGYILGATSPRLLITPDRFGALEHCVAHRGIVAQHGVPWAIVGDAAELPAAAMPFDSLLLLHPRIEPVAADPDQPALIAFTSGTTKDPKGVIHTHRSIVCETHQLSARLRTGGWPQLVGAPVGHFIGMVAALLAPLVRHEPIHLLDVWNPGEVVRLMREEGLGFGGGATYFLTSVLDHPDFTDDLLAQMPYIGLGGAPVPAVVPERATRLGITVHRAYGSTEHPSITGSSVDAPADKRLHTDGRALEGVEVRLEDDGQILSRGPDLCAGYTDPALTAAVFDDDGWYRTGDVGVLDSDGYLSITDRIADVIIRGGENISAQEIEELLARMPGVAEIAVIAEPDERLGERAAAIVRLLPGAAEPSLSDLRAHLAAAGLARQKWPESIHLVADFPRTPSGKIQKFRLRDELRRGT